MARLRVLLFNMTDLKNFVFNLTLTFLSANKRLSWRGRQEIIDIEFYRVRRSTVK